MKVSVRLFGRLAEACGPGPHCFDVAALSEIGSALLSQFDVVADLLQAPHRVIADGRMIPPDEWTLPLLAPCTVKVVPEPIGSGGGSFLNYAGGLASVRFSTASRSEVMGVAGTAAYGAVSHPASLLKGAQGAYEHGTSQLSGTVDRSMSRWGASSLLTGFSETPVGTDPNDPDALPAPGGGTIATRRAVFTGEAPTAIEGGPVPIRFGRQMVEGIVISVKLSIVHELVPI